ncbi:hypothetical protein DFH09DRAFT_1285708 [Mycena vulgaris]|nr:hypothetical protein DFH09DRAFT_1285708 [Mycena vulgaris]
MVYLPVRAEGGLEYCMPSPEGENLGRWRKNKRRACGLSLNARSICAGNGNEVHGMSGMGTECAGPKGGDHLGGMVMYDSQRSSMTSRSGVGARLPGNCRAGPREEGNGCGANRRWTGVEDDVRAKWHRFREGARSHEAVYEYDCGVRAREAAFENNYGERAGRRYTGTITAKWDEWGGEADLQSWADQGEQRPEQSENGAKKRAVPATSSGCRGRGMTSRWSRITPDHRAAFGTWCRRSGSRAFRSRSGGARSRSKSCPISNVIGWYYKKAPHVYTLTVRLWHANCLKAASFGMSIPQHCPPRGLVLTLAVCTIYYTSPMRLTRVLVAAIAHTEAIYLEALEAGVLSNSDVHTPEIMSSLQLKVSHLREASLRHSLSYSTTVSEFLKGRMLTLLQCIWEVRALETRIEILKEEQLRALDSRIGVGTISLRRRRTYSRLNFCHGH